MFGNFTPEQLLVGPVRAAIQNSFLWLIFFLGLSAIGIAVQLLANRRYEIVAYNRLEDEPANLQPVGR
jgi:hypothetical protein